VALASEHLYSLVITLLIVTAVGIGAARKVKSANDFAVGGYSSGVTIVTGTVIGTVIGGASTVGTAQLAFMYGLSAWWFTLGTGLALVVMALFYARPLRATGLQTIPQFLVGHFGAASGPLASLTSSLGIFFSIAANTLSAVPLITAMFAFDAMQGAGLVFALVVAYVFFGGVWGAGLVGVVKTIILYIMLVAIGWTTYTAMGGWAGYTAAFPAQPWFDLFGRGLWTDLGAALSLLIGTLSTQTYVQALYAARDGAIARRGALVAAAINIPAGIPAVMAGMFMRLHHPDIAPIEALPLYILHYLPPWLGGIAMAALLLATVGSAAGLALGVGTMVTQDIMGGLVRRGGDVAALWLNRAVVLAVALAAALFTFGNLKSVILEWNYLSMGLRGAGIFLPLTLAIFRPGRVAPRLAVWSMAAGAGVTLTWKLVLPQGLDPLYAGLAASAIFLAAGWRKK
jgi:SSS family solute:Na+ symporter